MLVGPNGAGKTNVLEAISFLAPGRGLRRATLEDVAFVEGDGSWAVSADVEGALGLAMLATGIDPPQTEDASLSRKYRIDREPVPSATAFARSPAGQLARPGDGRAVRGPGLGAAALSRPAGAGGRCRPHDTRQRARSRAALAQPAPGGSARRPALARCHRARNRRTRGCGERDAGRNRVATADRPRRALQPTLAVPRRRGRARRLDGQAGAAPIRRSRSRTATAPSCAKAARATPPPAARSTARTSPISR